MNKKILCIAEPSSFANFKIAEIVSGYFVSRGDIVDYLLPKNNNKLPIYEKLENGEIFRFETPKSKNLRRFGRFFHATEWREMPNLVRKMTGLWGRTLHPMRPRTDSVHLDSMNYGDVFETLAKQNKKYDVILSFSYPLALHILASKLKECGFAERWTPIFLDPYVFSFYLSKRSSRLRYRKRLVERLLLSADEVFVARGIVEENLKNGYTPEYHKKCITIELPNLVKREDFKAAEAKGKTTLAYAGMFYKDIRNPEKMLDVLSQLPRSYDIVVMGVGCEDVFESKKKLFEGNLNHLGRTESSKCQDILSKSNILINLGNTITNQTPSKVFEYIGLGKPVLNFYFDETDTSLYYFRKYPLAFNFNLNSYTDKTVEDLLKFCEENKSARLSFEEATKNLVNSRSDVVLERIYTTVFKD